MKIIISLLVLILTGGFALGQSGELRNEHFNLKKNLALEGYDPVSYFKGKPEKGDSDIKFEYHNIVYQFASPANLSTFKLNPGKYEPAYGGWCAFAMGETGEKVKVDPQTFKIWEGKLYLFYNFWGHNTQEDWSKNEKKLREAADHNWKNIVR